MAIKESVIEKFREGLSPEDFTQLEESIAALVEDKAKIRAEFLIEEEKNRLEELAEDFCKKEVSERLEKEKVALDEAYEVKVSEFKKTATEKLEEMADKYVDLKINESVSKKIVELEEQYEQKAQKLEETVLDQLDKFIDMEISSKISDELLTDIAINEAYKPVIQGVMKLFETNLVELNVDGSKQIKEMEKKVLESDKKLNEAYEEKIKLHEKNDKLKSACLIASKVDGLTNTQKKRVVNMFEGKNFDEVNSKIDDFVSLLEEKESEKSVDEYDINEDIFTGLDSEDILNESEIEKSKENDKIEFDWEKVNSILNK